MVKIRTAILKKGTKVFLSKTGHNNFYYPCDEYETLLEDVEAKELAWVGGNTKNPFIIPANSIYSTSDPKKIIAVWVEKK